MFDHGKAIAIQVGSGTYLIASFATWSNHVDFTIKSLIGVSMIILCWHQIFAIRRKNKRTDDLELLVRKAQMRCEKAILGQCALSDELRKTVNEPPLGK